MTLSQAKKLEVEERRATVAKLVRRGKSKASIARQFGVAPIQITRDYDELLREWRESRIEDVDAQQNIALAKLSELESEAWEQWERSKEDGKRIVENEGGGPNTVGTSTTTTGQCGDPRYLETVRKCIEDQRKILGIDVADTNDTLGDKGEIIQMVIVKDRADVKRIVDFRETALGANGNGNGEP